MKLTSLFLVFLMVPFLANARMFPKGKEPKLLIHPLAGTGITESDFNALLNVMEAKFQPIYAAKHQTLRINRLWTNPTINSDAQWQGNVCVINAYGGLARAPGMTKNAYLAVNGHENGHCSGQPPLYPGTNMSDEGQADTFAVDAAKLAGLTDTEIQQASRELTGVLAMLSGEPAVQWPGPVLPAVRATYHEHSAAQCRMDSMMFRDLSAERPNCWYLGGTITGSIPNGHPIPTPVPTPLPTPIPTPLPNPDPGGCHCCFCNCPPKAK